MEGYTRAVSIKENRDPDASPSHGLKDHVCTDVPCLLFLFCNLAFLSWISIYAWNNGDYRRLTNGYSKEKQICGLDTNKSFLFWCQDPYTKDFLVDYPMCIDACPHSNETSRICANTTGNVSLPDYPTQSSGSWCFPQPDHQPGTKHVTSHDLRHLSNQVFGSSWGEYIVRLYRDVILVAPNVATVGAFIGIIAGYSYLFLLQKCARVLAYLILSLMVVSTAGVGGYCLYAAARSVNVDGEDTGAELRAGCVLIVIGTFVVVWVASLLTELDTAVSCIEASCECLMEEPMLFTEPFVAFLGKAACLAFFGTMFLLLLSTGKVDLVGHYGIRRWLEFSPEQWVYLGFFVFSFFWAMEMNTAASHYVIAWIAQHWYLTPVVDGVKDSGRGCRVVEGFFNLFRYHLGTIALGALIVSYTAPARLVIGFFVRLAEGKDNPMAKLIASCICCVTCYERYLEPFDKNAYIDVAITSSPFLASAGRAQKLLNDGPNSMVKSLNGTQLIFQVMGRLLVALCCMHSVRPTLKFLGLAYRVESPLFVAGFGGILGVFIGDCFMNVFDMVGDTILYCFALEAERRAVVAQARIEHEPEPTWWGYLVGTEDSEDDDLDYAPPKLKVLLQQHTEAELLQSLGAER
mmetsp:Transcript_30857/g.88727  ORF Transcript_30857/g.88727 Transcript_30857/m.88727 type:complete len:632 (-) Transcript_30857:206-2101(-)